MQKKNNIKLIDEALAQESVKNTFRLAWEFISLNKTFTFTVMSILIFLYFLNIFSGGLTMMFSGIFSLAIQIYLAKMFYEAEDISSYVSQIQESQVKKIIREYTLTATGVYTAWMALLLLPILIVSVLITKIILSANTIGEEELLIRLITTIGIPVFIIVLILSYIQPLVQAKIAMAKNYKEGFFAVFSIFSKDVWKRAFQKSYFKYISIVGIVIFGAGLLLGIIFFIPYISSLVPFIIIVLMYLYMVIMAIASMMAKRLVE